MKVFRIAQEKYINDLEGTGARLYGGRWNRPGVSVLYTAEHLSLAILELIVHFDSRQALENDYAYITLDIDEALIERFDPSKLPNNLTGFNQESLWETLDYYFYNKGVFALKVPSVLVPGENNILLNPLHEAMARLRKVKLTPEEVRLDKRFVKTT